MKRKIIYLITFNAIWFLAIIIVKIMIVNDISTTKEQLNHNISLHENSNTIAKELLTKCNKEKEDELFKGLYKIFREELVNEGIIYLKNKELTNDLINAIFIFPIANIIVAILLVKRLYTSKETNT